MDPVTKKPGLQPVRGVPNNTQTENGDAAAFVAIQEMLHTAKRPGYYGRLTIEVFVEDGKVKRVTRNLGSTQLID